MSLTVSGTLTSSLEAAARGQRGVRRRNSGTACYIELFIQQMRLAVCARLWPTKSFLMERIGREFFKIISTML